VLDSETKARIDSARDILVGKVPDPKSQVEQITIALIYKFMDDMDRQSEELGGKASFFAGDFKKYRWAQLLDRRFSGHERLLLYAEGIEKMNINKNIPQLFRDIFKGVFLPYRDPETLNLFLKEINGFSYDHSERLGDAFEYLLSVLGTQGDAGQFRTPRHIIDFIAAVVDPKKNETVLDPACGTAGFLIAAFKHILKNGENLTPDERAQLMTNFRGYDIAPDMVRLSRVNLYLHGFPNPVIHEYDTLTSVDRWDERCDVIMANPPFMSPKGGIRPHNRFSIQAKRSEVLFVDYIAEHLTSGGRAGVIVPEGIIFQSQNAYKALRKMLVENGLWTVVSLPAGVFNPYSGVKTSIFFLDKSLAKRTDDVLFVKIENDGFDLGAQRRPIEGGQLAEALALMNRYKNAPRALEEKTALTVPRTRLLASPDINLSGDRYRTAAVRHSGKWPMVKLGEVCTIIAGQSPNGSTYNNRGEGMPFHQGKTEFTDTFLGIAKSWTTAPAKVSELYDIVMSVRAPVGPVNIVRERICIGRGLAAIRPQLDKLLYMLLFYLLKGMQDQIIGKDGAAFASINREEICNLEIPLPPLDEQERIVAELEGYRKVIEGARQILASYKPTIWIDPSWPMVELGDVCEIRSGGTPSRSEDSYWNGTIPWMGSTVCKDQEVISAEEFITEAGLTNSAAKLFSENTTLIALVGATIGKTALLKFAATTNQNVAGLYPKSPEILEPVYLFYAAQRLYSEFIKLGEGKFRMANLTFVRQQKIPLPPLDVQREIVAELEAERKLVEANRELIARMEARIRAKLDEVWGRE
jgi:type I restriction enzyme M protein